MLYKNLNTSAIRELGWSSFNEGVLQYDGLLRMNHTTGEFYGVDQRCYACI